MDISFEKSFKVMKIKGLGKDKDIIRFKRNRNNCSEINKCNDTKSIPPQIYKIFSEKNNKKNCFELNLGKKYHSSGETQRPLSKSHEYVFKRNDVKLPYINHKLDKVEEYFDLEVNIKDEILRRCKNRQQISISKNNSKSNMIYTPKINKFHQNNNNNNVNHNCNSCSAITLSPENTCTFKASLHSNEVECDIVSFSNLSNQDRIKNIRAEIIKDKFNNYNSNHNLVFRRQMSIMNLDNKSRFFHVEAKSPLEQITPKLIINHMINNYDLVIIKKDNENYLKRILIEE